MTPFTGLDYNTIPIVEQLNGDGTVNYFKWRYKGSDVKIKFGYNNQGRINKIEIPSFLNMSHKEIFNILAKMLQATNPVRGAFYDRPPAVTGGNVTVNLNYGANILAPHALTTRATITVPANEKFMVQSADLFVMRLGVDSVASGLCATHLYAPGRTATAVIDENTLYVKDHVFIHVGTVLNGGETLTIRTINGDNGDGSVMFWGVVNGVRYDA